jgi:AcrR family transcriptional regulator
VLSEFAFTEAAASPRKVPLQARAQATVAAILEATSQVLGTDGPALTTTRVAEVAGVSVGTLYQYFPHREALLHALLGEHLEVVARAVEDAEGDGTEPVAVVIERVVRAVLAVKAARAPISERLNQVFAVGALDDRPVVAAATRRIERVVARILAGGGAPDPATATRAGILCAALDGVVRAAVAEDLGRLRDPVWVEQVVAFALAAART